MEKWNHSRNPFRNLPLSWKFSIPVILMMLTLGIAATLTIEHRLTASLHAELIEDGYAIGNSLAAGAAYHLLGNDRKGIRNLLESAITMKKELAFIYLSDPDHQTIAKIRQQSLALPIAEITTLPRTGHGDQSVIHLPGGDNIQEITVPLRGGKLGAIHIGLSESSYRETIASTRNDLILVISLITVSGLLLLLTLIRMMTKPLARLAQTAARISQGDFEIKLDTSDDEIGRLAQDFNRMASQLQEQRRNREAAEKSLQESEALYRLLIDNIDLGISMIDQDYEVQLINAGHGRLSGRTPESCLNQKCYRLFEGREIVCPHCPGTKAMRSGRVEEAEASGWRADGSPVRVRLKAFPVRDTNGEISGFIEIVSDISAQRQMEEEIKLVKNIESIGQLAGGLAHDFNNILTTLIGNIELAKSEIGPEENAFPRLEAAGNACDQARKLINQLLTFARGGLPVKISTFLPELLNEACHFALSGSSLRYVLDAPANIWPVEIDAGQMSQVLHNLLANAKEAMSQKDVGKLFVIAENLVLEETSTTPLPPGRYVKITIADEGCGIKADDLEKIFLPYFTTKALGRAKGTGLGLTICHSIVRNHGGHLTVTSAENRGTTFSLYLPAAEGESGEVQPGGALPEAAAPAPLPDLRILVLEDEDDVAMIANSYLVALHQHCSLAGTGKEAMALCEKALRTGQPYDLLVLDLTVRGGMGGREVLAEIRKLQPHIPAIVASGYTADPIMVDYRRFGFQAALPKPFTLGSLRAAISQATARP